jgi:hypothetical protein
MNACKLVAGYTKLFPPSSGQKQHFRNPNKQLQIAEYYNPTGRDSSIGIATRYGLDGPEIKSCCGRRFPHPSRQALGSPSLIWWLPHLPWSKAPGAWRWPPTPPSAEVKGRVQLYLYSTSGPSWSLIRWPSTYRFIITHKQTWTTKRQYSRIPYPD